MFDAFGQDITAEQWRLAGLWALGVVGAATVGLIVHALLFAALRRLTNRTEGIADSSFVRHGAAPARLLFPLIAALIIRPPADVVAIVDIARHILGIGLIVAVAWSLVELTHVVDDLVRQRWNIDRPDNLEARKMHTKVRIFRKATVAVVSVFAAAAILMTFPAARQLGASILASAGIAGIVVGLAARPILTNLLSGMQIALTETLHIDDVVIVEGEWGRIEEIASTYVVVRIWDQRRLIVPINYFVEQPFQNWTRTTADLLGTVFIHCDYTVPVDAVRAELRRILEEDARDLWDGKVQNVQITDATERTMTLRALVSASDSSNAWNLRCLVREKLIGWLQREHPRALPRMRAAVERAHDHHTPA